MSLTIKAHRHHMLQFSRGLWSNALHNSTPFVEGALQLVKLHLAHLNARADKNEEASHAIEDEFLREVEAFRPQFTMAASLEVAQQYSKRLYAALRHFGLGDDPMVRQLDLLMGKESLRSARSSGANSAFKGCAPLRRRNASNEAWSTLNSLDEVQVVVLPTELPNPPQVDRTAARRHGTVQVPLRHRGHWVLQEPEIAQLRSERREDPW